MVCMWLSPPEERLTDRLRARLRSTWRAHQRREAQLEEGQKAQSRLGTRPPGSAVANAKPQRDRLGTRVDADLLVDAAEVVLHGLVRDEQLLRDVAVGAAARKQVEDLALARRERPQALLARVVLGAGCPPQHVEHGRRHGGREEHLPARHSEEAVLGLPGAR